MSNSGNSAHVSGKDQAKVASAIFIAMILGLGITQYSCMTLENRAATSHEQKRQDARLAQELPTIEFCDLLKNPHSYDSQAIRVNGSLGRFQDYITFYNSACVPKHPLINVVLDRSLEYDKTNPGSAKLVEILSGSQNARDGNVHVFVTAVGLFRPIPRSVRQDFSELQYEFTVRKIERIQD